jgi:hypothetical protein
VAQIDKDMANSVCSFAPLDYALLPAGFCAGVLPVKLAQPRSIIVASSTASPLATGGGTDFWALERGTSSVVAVQDLDGDGFPETKKTVAHS